MSYLISPHGGSLCNLLVTEEKAQELKEESLRCLSIDFEPETAVRSGVATKRRLFAVKGLHDSRRL